MVVSTIAKKYNQIPLFVWPFSPSAEGREVGVYLLRGVWVIPPYRQSISLPITLKTFPHHHKGTDVHRIRFILCFFKAQIHHVHEVSVFHTSDSDFCT